MKRKLGFIKGFLLCLGLTSALALAQPREVEAGSLTLTIPADWYQTTVPSDEPYTRVVLASNSEVDDQALMMVSVVPKEGRTLNAMLSATRNYIATRMDGVLEYERQTTVDGAPARIFVYEGRSEHSSQGRRKFMRAIVDRGNSFYILHGVADHIPFAHHAGTMESLINSARWVN